MLGSWLLVDAEIFRDRIGVVCNYLGRPAYVAVTDRGLIQLALKVGLAVGSVCGSIVVATY